MYGNLSVSLSCWSVNLDPLEVGNIIDRVNLQARQKYCCKMGYSARCIEVKQEELRPERLTLFICLWGVRLHSVAMPGPSARWLCNWNDFLEQHISTVEHTHRFISEFFFFFQMMNEKYTSTMLYNLMESVAVLVALRVHVRERKAAYQFSKLYFYKLMMRSPV